MAAYMNHIDMPVTNDAAIRLHGDDMLYHFGKLVGYGLQPVVDFCTHSNWPPCQEGELALVKRQKLADIEKYEAETRAAKEKPERDQTQVQRARIQAERQQVEDDAKAAREERDRQRVHVAELAEEKRRAEIRRAAEDGAIAPATADELLGENRRTPILRFERWIGTALRCPKPSGCSSVLKQRFNASVAVGEHAKPAGHRDFSGGWVLFEEHDGAHQAMHDVRNGLQPGQQRLFA